MKPTPPSKPHELALARRIDQACDHFEAAWRQARATGNHPRIEDYLGVIPKSEQPALLLELIVTDIHHRRQRGDSPKPEDYQLRFPILDPQWLAEAVGRSPGERPGPPPSDEPEATGPYISETPEEHKEPPTSHDPVPSQGRSVGGYELIQVIGRGGMGVVYKARQQSLNRVVALKMILAGAEAGPQELARFRREAEALGALSHANIVQIFEIGEHEGRPFFSLEYVAGGSLARRLDGTPWPARRSAALVETLARAIHAAHEAGLVHRDLKPANVLLTAAGTPKITDFGLVKQLDGRPGLTASDAVMGTPSYMAPEQAKGKAKVVGPLADIYALGATLYHLLTGRAPFKGETPMDTIMQVLSEDPVRPRQLNSKMPRDLEAICLKCLEKEPHKRYRSALALADDLQRFLAGKSIRARPVRFWNHAIKWSRRNPVLAILMIATILGGCLTVLMNPGYSPPNLKREHRSWYLQDGETGRSSQQLPERPKRRLVQPRESTVRVVPSTRTSSRQPSESSTNPSSR